MAASFEINRKIFISSNTSSRAPCAGRPFREKIVNNFFVTVRAFEVDHLT